MSAKMKNLIKAAAVRAVKTVAQTAVATIGTAAVMDVELDKLINDDEESKVVHRISGVIDSNTLKGMLLRSQNG